MTTTRECICVWLDTASNPADPKWIVSHDQLDDRDRAETTHTLSVHDGEAEATEEARAQGLRAELPVYRNMMGEPAALLAGEPDKSDTALTDLLATNGQPDDDEPWCAGDACPTIEIRGEDLVALCTDGVARWTNYLREWSEVEPAGLRTTLEEVYESGQGGNLDKAARLLGWMGRFWAVGPLADYLDTEDSR